MRLRETSSVISSSVSWAVPALAITDSSQERTRCTWDLAARTMPLTRDLINGPPNSWVVTACTDGYQYSPAFDTTAFPQISTSKGQSPRIYEAHRSGGTRFSVELAISQSAKGCSPRRDLIWVASGQVHGSPSMPNRC